MFPDNCRFHIAIKDILSESNGDYYNSLLLHNELNILCFPPLHAHLFVKSYKVF